MWSRAIAIHSRDSLQPLPDRGHYDVTTLGKMSNEGRLISDKIQGLR